MQFRKLERKNLPRLLPYFQAQQGQIGNYSAGLLFMWGRYLSTQYCEEEGCLFLVDHYFGNSYFYYPLSKDGDEAAEERGVEKLEAYCRENDVRLHFTNVPREKLPSLVLRYGAEVHVSNIRRWRDYLYNAEDFKTYAGGRYSGQRNHVNKFKKTYPDFEFCTYDSQDMPAVEAFLQEYSASQYAKEDTYADEEMKGVFEILPHIGELGMYAGFLRAGGKIVAFSVGERCGDMMVVHIEKALRGVQGAYPTIAQLFAQTFCGNGIQYINREDDSGDFGLRKSKLQYLPLRLVDKYNLAVKRPIDSLSKLPELETERLVLKEVAGEDVHEFARLARDDQLNRFWGYNWHDDAPDTAPDSWFLEDIRNDFKKKNELPLGVYFEGALVGEVVLYHFGYAAEAEIGMRILPERQGRGFARESLLGLMEYGFCKLGLERIEAKCYKENTASAYTLKSAGMRPCGEDETYFYFYKTAAM